MDIFLAIILGVIEGATEFLPISSTAHLVVSEKLLGFKDEASLFTVVVQLGAILAAAWYFRKDLANIFKKLVSGDKPTKRFVVNVFLGLLPAGLIGLIVEKLWGIPDSLIVIAISLIVGGVIIWIVENHLHTQLPKTDSIDYAQITPKRSLTVGFAQALAIIPGVSRSGATIVSGMLSGLDRKTATVFSFYLSIPIMLAASALKLKDDHTKIHLITGGNIGVIVGTTVAFVSAFMAVKWLLRYVQTHNLKPFAYYRIVLGLVILCLLIGKVL
ncbi:undecaprenyl-diphosphate phosphatase [Candidatus Saccharibacteria bacterium]|nr:undecaprenyl-diphosphate phosphatase [Candidatus Saccharibacteria bacterium]